MKTITTDTVLMEDVVGDASFEYRIGKNIHLTLILTIVNPKNKTNINVAVRLPATGARATIIGLVVGNDASAITLHTLQHHQAPRTTSNLLVKGVFKDHATFLYDGAIRVEKDAQKTDAYQRNENLLLSPQAFAESKPSLEILANDVRCTHGVTVANLAKDQLWYLATRGIAPADSCRLLVAGFLESALKDVPTARTRGVVDRVLAAV